MTANSFRRSKYYDEPFLVKLANIALSRPISDFCTEEEKKGRTIALRTFFNIMHTLATFNYHHQEFKKYLMEVMKILMLQEQPLETNTFFKMLWGLCVLYPRHQLAGIYPLIERYITKV